MIIMKSEILRSAKFRPRDAVGWLVVQISKFQTNQFAHTKADSGWLATAGLPQADVSRLFHPLEVT